MEEDLAGRAYQEQLTSTEGMRRGAGGRVIFNKDTKRGREREAEGDIMVSSARRSSSPEEKGKRWLIL